MKQETIWGDPEVVFSAPTPLSVQFSRLGDALAVVPSDFQLSFEKDNGPTSLTQVVTLRVPVALAAGQRLIGYVQDLTFGYQRSPGTGIRVLIVADLAGTLKTVEFDFENETAPSEDVPWRLERGFSPQGLESAGAGSMGLFGTVADYAATISITLQRRHLSAFGSVSIQGLDVFPVLTPLPAAKTT